MEEFANPQRTGAAHRLEGSRFSSRQLYNLAAGGSREWPMAMQFYRSACIALRNRTAGQKRYAGSFPGAAC
jgi:hypothetical protein